MQPEYLASHNLLRATNPEGLPERLAGLLPPHRYSRPAHAGFRYCLNQLPLGIGSLSYSSWSRGTNVFSYDFDTYVAVILVDGVEELETPSMRCRWRPGDGAIFSPGECFNRTAVTDCAHLTLRLKPGVVQEYLSEVLPRRPAQPLRFDSPVVGGSRRGSAVARTLQFAAAQLEDVSAEETGGLVGDVERLLLDTLLFLQPNNHSQRISARRPPPGPAYIAAVEQYIRAHCGENLTLESLAAQAGVGVRALNGAFRKHRGTSPMQYLKSARLARVRQELERAGTGVRVADIATRWGFYQLGWFAAEYRKVYGELPSETLRRCAAVRRHRHISHDG